MENIIIDAPEIQCIYSKKAYPIGIFFLWLVIVLIHASWLYKERIKALVDIDFSSCMWLVMIILGSINVWTFTRPAFRAINNEPVLEIDADGFWYHSPIMRGYHKILWRDVKGVLFGKKFLIKSIILTIDAKSEYLENMKPSSRFLGRKHIKTTNSFGYALSSFELDTDMQVLFEKMERFIKEKA